MRMNACLFRQLTRSRCNRVPFHPGLQSLSQKSVKNVNCTCTTVSYHKYKYGHHQHSKNLSMSTAHRVERRVTETFDEYYTAVLDAHKSNENLILYKYKALSDNPAEREVQLKRWMFVEAVDIYTKKSVSPHFSGLRRGHVEFIRQALQRMYELGVHREAACYNALIKVFPEEIMVPKTMFQIEFYHYPKQQDSCFEILEQMQDNAVIPDQETREILEARFGKHSHTDRKVRRMIYWLRKFQNLNPYKLPYYLPLNPIELAVLALNKMAADLENEIKVFKVTEHGEKTFIASAQSPTQRELIRKHPDSAPLYVEGGFMVWLRDKYQIYYILKSDSDPKLFQYPTKEEEEENLEFETIFDAEEPKELAPQPNLHQQEDGTILGMCITGTSTKDSLISWIRCLQEHNPSLEKIPVVFTLRSPEEAIEPVTAKEDRNEHKEHEEPSK